MTRPDGTAAERQGRLPAGRVRWGIGVIVVVTLLAYLPALRGGFIWDDDDYVTENELLHDVEGLGRLWRPGRTRQYYPLVFTTFWIEYHLWGLDPLGYHLVNVLLHVANALLVWRLMWRLRVRGAWFIAAVFALHPVHVESVAWITERKNVLSGFFYLLAALSALRGNASLFGEDPAVRASRQAVLRGVLWYLAGLGLLLLALLSKTVACSLPAALVLLFVCRHDEPWSRRLRRMLPTIPMFLVALPLALHTASLERISVGAVGSEFDLGLIERTLIASRALLFYPFKLLVPYPLVFIYPRWRIDPGDVVAYWPLAVVLAIAVACLFAWRHHRRGIVLAVAFYAGTMFPALGFFNVYPMRYSFVADHFCYLASLGIIALVVAGVIRLLPRIAWGAGGALVLGALAVLTWRQGPQYADAETLWRHTIAANPGAWMAHNNLGATLLERGSPEEAMPHLRAALEAKPDHYQAHGNLALALAATGRHEEAVTHWTAVVGHEKAVAQDHFRMGETLEALERREEAIDRYRRALDRFPDHLAARLRLGKLLLEDGRADEAQEQFEFIVARDPANVTLQRFLGGRAEAVGDFVKAVRHYELALTHARAETEYVAAAVRLAVIRAMCADRAVRRPAEAVVIAQRLDELTLGRDPFVHHILAAALAGLGRFDDAVAEAERAIELAGEQGRSELVDELLPRLEAYRVGNTDPMRP